MITHFYQKIVKIIPILWTMNINEIPLHWNQGTIHMHHQIIKKNNTLSKNLNQQNPFIAEINFFKKYCVNTLLEDSNGKIYVGTSERGLFYSSDHGEHWQEEVYFSKNLKNPDVNCLIQTKNNDIYATVNARVYRKQPNSNHWTQILKLGRDRHYRCWSLIQTNDQQIHVEYRNYQDKVPGFMKSDDGGQSWHKDPFFQALFDKYKNNYIYQLLQTNTGIIYALTEKATYTAIDQQSWTKISDDTLPSLPTAMMQTHNNELYMNTVHDGVWKSIDQGISWTKTSLVTQHINAFLQTKNGDVYYGGNLFLKKSSLKQIFSYQTTGKQFTNTQKTIFNQQFALHITSTYVQQALLNQQVISLPYQKTIISPDEYHLVLTLKKSFLKLFQDTFAVLEKSIIKKTFWIKKSVQKQEINFNTNDDTNLYQALTSNTGNTKNWKIIQTEKKPQTGVHPASLSLNLSSRYLKWSACYWTPGSIDLPSNDFIPVPNSQTKINPPTASAKIVNLTWSQERLYHLHLEDIVSNQYDAVLEISKPKWNTKGDFTFNDQQIHTLAEKLHVTIAISGLSNHQRKNIITFLEQLNNQIISKIDHNWKLLLSQWGGGFDIYEKYYPQIKQISYSLAYFLPLKITDENVTRLDPNHIWKENQFTSWLQQKIILYRDQYIENTLQKLQTTANQLRVSVSDQTITNENQLRQYQQFLINYQAYIKQSFTLKLKNVIDTIGLGYLTSTEQQQIRHKFTLAWLKQQDHFLKPVIWTPKTTADNEQKLFDKYLNWKVLSQAVQKYINTFSPNPQQKLQQAINQAVQQTNMHGATLTTLLAYGHKQLPKNKQEINHFAGAKINFQQWLQQTSDHYYHHQRTMKTIKITAGIIGGVLGAILLMVGIWWWYRVWIKGKMKVNKNTGNPVVPDHLKKDGWKLLQEQTKDDQ